jgi:hypothetical protein
MSVSKKVTAFLLIALLIACWRCASVEAFGKTGTPCIECHKGTTAETNKFHTGSTSECSECHVGKGPALKFSDASSTCLHCHEAPQGTRKPTGHYVATNTMDLQAGLPPSQLTPGGDFGWLKKNYSWKSSGESGTSPGERHGHNIVASDYGYVADSRLRTSSNGRYPSRELSCVSCHDPHGKIAIGTGSAGSYRILGGKGYKTAAVAAEVFTADAPVAVSPLAYNRSESTTDTRVAYGAGMSEWCGNCHTSGCTGTTHPAGKCANCGLETLSNYNAYVKSGDINGSADRAYTSLVTFEEGTYSRDVLALHAQNNGSYTRGAEPGSNVMCLTCHRAHASGWSSIARWNMDADFIVYRGKYPGTDNGSPADHAQGRTAAETQKALYDRPISLFATTQRGLCNKCHTKD